MATLRELLEPHKAEVVETWLSVIRDANAPHAARVAAANALADRLEGKPAQTVQGPPDANGAPTAVTLNVAFRGGRERDD